MRNTCIAVGMLFAAASAMADGPYGQVTGGGNHQRDQDLGNSGTLGFDEGGVGSAALGYAFSMGLRPEFEYSYRQNDASSANGGYSNGTERTNAAMTNLWYDFRTPWLQGRLHPYAGAGIGAANVRLDQVRDAAGNARTGDDDVFAYQTGAGVGFNADRNLSFTLGYRYFETSKAHFGGAAPIDARYRSDGVLAGVRYAFGFGRSERYASARGARSTEMAAFETVMLRPVAFQPGKAELTASSKGTLDDIAARLKAHKDMNARIAADSSGSKKDSRKLAARRADAVRDYLVKKGIAADRLQVASLGNEPPADSSLKIVIEQ